MPSLPCIILQPKHIIFIFDRLKAVNIFMNGPNKKPEPCWRDEPTINLFSAMLIFSQFKKETIILYFSCHLLPERYKYYVNIKINL